MADAEEDVHNNLESVAKAEPDATPPSSSDSGQSAQAPDAPSTLRERAGNSLENSPISLFNADALEEDDVLNIGSESVSATLVASTPNTQMNGETHTSGEELPLEPSWLNTAQEILYTPSDTPDVSNANIETRIEMLETAMLRIEDLLKEIGKSVSSKSRLPKEVPLVAPKVAPTSAQPVNALAFERSKARRLGFI